MAGSRANSRAGRLHTDRADAFLHRAARHLDHREFQGNATHLHAAGQPVTIQIDAFPGKTFKGHVDSLQSGTGARFSLLPAENATGNYVKVVQRVPVKIRFDESPEVQAAFAPGLSVEPEVNISCKPGDPDFVVPPNHLLQ